jgi:3',5'-cyclic-AMP phosphodiesterase
MPLHLPQLSRREFLKRAALAGAAIALAPAAHAGWFGKARDKQTFVLFSDSHIAADLTRVERKVNMADSFGLCVREVLAMPKAPVAVLVNGDLAYKLGQPEDYLAFANLLSPLRAVAPVHLSLGNHDNWEDFRRSLPHDAGVIPAVPQKQVAVIQSKWANLFLLDSLDATNVTPGTLGLAQLKWLDKELAAHPKLPAIVLCHHNLDPLGVVGLKDTAALEELFRRHPQVKAFIYGHTHTWQVEKSVTGVQLVNLPPTGYVFQEGRPSGWVRMTLSQNGAELELRCLDRQHPEHGRIKKLEWRAAA